MHQTVSLIGTSHMVSGYYTFWQGSEKNATGEGKQYWPTEKQNIPFRIPWKLLTSSRHFLRSSTAFSREIAEREHGSQVLKALTLSKTLPQLWAELLTFSGQHDTQTDTAKKKKKAKASDVPQTFSICSWVSQAQRSGSHKPLQIDLLQRRVSVTESASHGQCLPPEKSSGLPVLYSPSPNSQQPPAFL